MASHHFAWPLELEGSCPIRTPRAGFHRLRRSSTVPGRNEDRHQTQSACRLHADRTAEPKMACSNLTDKTWLLVRT